ncbi:short-chain dehydrogenase [Longispora fulva]|uniref:NAD(P)-dependent dehydrogenase (Short-subunit alcohol dehydrogenase family) n=1 Tax=Longispora fulva TaxID=619741 RepID=A0A8J7G6A5_9ACTN|nr:SDR family NAD(P)-dependent oxidoreductase [Longispora fulva]MBG6134478.1 NAD(P)-dependent dehydrogenase (short-subunit alcohol dehydrogenase family) [Longispora fulva]GIG62608.1 short-chain dehydrogenase [Longispora fulva]
MDAEDTGAADAGTKKHSRRRILTTGAVGVGGVLAGVVGGVALAQAGSPTPVIRPSGSRRFEGKTVLITGGTSGIGRAAARQFAAEGGKVGFCGRREALGRQVENEIRSAGGEATYIRADVRSEDDVRRFVNQVASTYGGLDVCFNNAGITQQKALHEYSAAEWDDVVGTNLRGNFLALRYEIPHLLTRGGGVVLVTSSSNAISTAAGRSAYAAAKRGLVGLVQSAAADYAAKNIRINALLPGTTNTELVRRAAGAMDLPDSVWEVMATTWGKSNVPGLGRMASADEVAAFAVTLASPDFPYMTAAQMVFDGGKTAFGG